jgi:hypothetical protein
MGQIFDSAKTAAVGGDAAFGALTAAAEAGDAASRTRLGEVLALASRTSFQAVAVLPAILLLVFGAIWLVDRARGGYRPETLAARDSAK